MNLSIHELSSEQELDFFVRMEYEANRELHSGEAAQPSDEQLAEHRKELLAYVESKPQTKIFIAADAHTPIGLIWASVRDHNDIWDFEPLPAWIYDLRVLPANRQQGVGQKLLASAIDWAIAKELTRIGLHVFASNTPALYLYQRTGFAVSSYYLQKELTAPPTHPKTSHHFRSDLNEVDYEAIRILDYARFRATANRGIAVPEVETHAKYQQFWEAAKIREDFVCLAETANATLAGFAWAYASRGDLGDQRYVWLQSLHALPEEDALLKALLAQVEQWTLDQGLATIRTWAQTTNPQLPDVLQAQGYTPSNIFMHKRLSTADEKGA